MNKEKYLDIVLNYLCEEANVEINSTDLKSKIKLWRELVNKRNVVDIPEAILDAEDKFLRLNLLNKKLTNGEELKCVNDLLEIEIKHGDKICLWKGDITSIYCDAIVNSCSTDLLGCSIPNHTCLDNAIHSFSGMRLNKKCNIISENNKINVSDITVTRAYNLPCDFIIHACCPSVINKLTKENINDLEKTYFNILECAKSNLIKVLVIPALSTGEGKFPMEEAIDIAINVVNKYLDDYDVYFDKIIFNSYTDDIFDLYENKIKNID